MITVTQLILLDNRNYSILLMKNISPLFSRWV